MKRFIISLLISGILIYFALRGVGWATLKMSLAEIEHRYLLLVIPLLLLIQFLRSYRWGLILKPIKAVDQRTLFSITSVGLMGILLLPARTGEFVRPYLISQEKGIDFRSAVATIVVERVFDGITIMGLFVWIILFSQFPPWVYRAGYVSLAVFLAVLSALLLTIKKKEGALNLVRFFTGIFPQRVQDGIQAFINAFAEGLRILPDWRKMGFVIGLSLSIWILMGIVFYIIFQSFYFKLPLMAAYTVLVIVVIGVMIPGAPGFVGNFHLFCILGLSLFGIPKPEALSYAIVNHLIQVLFTLALGLAFLYKVKICSPFLIKNGKRSGVIQSLRFFIDKNGTRGRI